MSDDSSSGVGTMDVSTGSASGDDEDDGSDEISNGMNGGEVGCGVGM